MANTRSIASTPAGYKPDSNAQTVYGAVPQNSNVHTVTGHISRSVSENDHYSDVEKGNHSDSDAKTCCGGSSSRKYGSDKTSTGAKSSRKCLWITIGCIVAALVVIGVVVGVVVAVVAGGSSSASGSTTPHHPSNTSTTTAPPPPHPSSGTKYALYFLPTTDSLNAGLKKYPNAKAAVTAVQSSHLWGNQLHMTLAHFESLSTIGSVDSLKTAAQKAAKTVTAKAQPGKHYHIDASKWSNPSCKHNAKDGTTICLYHVSAGSSTLDTMMSGLASDGVHTSTPNSQGLHVSFLANGQSNSRDIKDLLGFVQWQVCVVQVPDMANHPRGDNLSMVQCYTA